MYPRTRVLLSEKSGIVPAAAERDGGHDDIDYSDEPPDPPLSREDRKWMDALLAKRRKSRGKKPR
jgi:hypothetical protein